jgi:DNA polymerase II small subunit
MNEQQVVKTLIEHGYQPHPNSIQILLENSEKLGMIIKSLKTLQPRPVVVTGDIVKKILTEKQQETYTQEKKLETKVEILETFQVKKTKYNVDDFVNYFNSRYNKIKKLLSKRLDLTNLISINKLTQRTKSFSIIALVREKNENNKYMIVEDMTGELQVFFSDPQFNEIIPDDVVGLRCEKKDSKYMVTGVVWPDIPLKRNISCIDKELYALFISGVDTKHPNFKKESYKNFIEWVNATNDLGYIFLTDVKDSRIFNDLPQTSSILCCFDETNISVPSNVIKLSNPCLVKIHEKIKVLITSGNFLKEYEKIFKINEPGNIIVNLLKRRHLSPVVDFNNIDSEDSYVMEEIPDIFVTNCSHKPCFKNYKGTTIICSGSFVTDPVFYLVNLKTREVIEKKF